MSEAHNATQASATPWRALLLIALGVFIGLSAFDWFEKRRRESAKAAVPEKQAWQVAADEEVKRARQLAETERLLSDGSVSAAKMFVQDHLVSPGSAKFGCPRGEWSACVTKVAPSRYRVSGAVDSQNRFGALIRSEWAVTVEHVSGTNWTMIGTPVLEER